MKIRIISIGKIKEKYLLAGINEYKKRLGAFTKIEIVELDDEKIPDKASIAEEQLVLEKEGKKILDRIKDDEYVILLDLHGKEIDSIELSKHIESKMIEGKSTITFVIGGSLGLALEVIKRSNFRLCFSKLTFTHQMIRLFLLEQIYRAFKIMNNQTYHK